MEIAMIRPAIRYMLIPLLAVSTILRADSIEDADSWKFLDQATNQAEANFHQALSKYKDKVFRWKSSQGTKFTLEVSSDPNRPHGMTECTTPGYLYHAVKLRVVPPNGLVQRYILCRNGFSTGFISIGQRTAGEDQNHLMIKHIRDRKTDATSFLASAINPKNGKTGFVCHLTIHAGVARMEASGTMTKKDCGEFIAYIRNDTRTYVRSILAQSEQVVKFFAG